MCSDKFIESIATIFLGRVRSVLKEDGTVCRSTMEPIVDFNSNSEVSSLCFSVDNDFVTVEVNWEISSSSTSPLNLKVFSKRLRLTAECVELFHILGFDYVVGGRDAFAVVMKKKYPHPVLEEDTEKLLLLVKIYLDKTEELLSREKFCQE